MRVPALQYKLATDKESRQSTNQNPMKEAPKPIIEYGVPIDIRTMVEPPDVAELELEPGHPGLGDAAYVERPQAAFRPLPRASAPAASIGSSGLGRR